MLCRFLWKEFRMLRGLWLAVAIMAILVQCAAKLLLPATSELPLTLLYIALASGVLYAAGSAATAFSVEHEEESYDFLTRLPAIWWPIFIGKLLATAVTAVLLSVTLSITAAAHIGGSISLSTQAGLGALGMLGFAVVEAVAWGTLFSLLVKRPLLAAILTLVVGAVAVNIAVNLTSTNAVASTTPEGYIEAIPLRSAIVIAVFAVTRDSCTRVADQRGHGFSLSTIRLNRRVSQALGRHDCRLAPVQSRRETHFKPFDVGPALVANLA